MMIRCNLSVLMAERNLKITKVSKDTGISRTTLTSLANNYSQGIQFETFNTLCMYFNVNPKELFSFIPIDIEIWNLTQDKESMSFQLEFLVTERNFSSAYPLAGEYRISRANSEGAVSVVIFIQLLEADVFAKDNFDLIRIFRMISEPFRRDIESSIAAKLLDLLAEDGDIQVLSDVDIFWDRKLLE